jgi:hypothetical protein
MQSLSFDAISIIRCNLYYSMQSLSFNAISIIQCDLYYSMQSLLFNAISIIQCNLYHLMQSPSFNETTISHFTQCAVHAGTARIYHQMIVDTNYTWIQFYNKILLD